MEQDSVLTIDSHNGWERVTFFNNIMSNNPPEEEVVNYRIVFSSKFWNRERLLFGETESLIPDQEIVFNQVIFYRDEWDEFIKKMSQWKVCGELFTVTFSKIDGRVVECSLIVTDDLQSSKETPVFKFCISDSKRNIVWKQVIK